MKNFYFAVRLFCCELNMYVILSIGACNSMVLKMQTFVCIEKRAREQNDNWVEFLVYV
jgi:hypothetical protein